MSAPTKPFAKGYGIFLGLVILWTASLVLFLIGVIGKLIFSGGGDAAV